MPVIVFADPKGGSAKTTAALLLASEMAGHGAELATIDLEGTASLMANAIGMSDLVIISTQGSSMDAKGAAKMIRLIRNQKRMTRRPIAHGVLMICTNAAMVQRSLHNVREQLEKADIPMFTATIVERTAYRSIFDYGGLLSDLQPGSVSNLDKACANAGHFAPEVIARLRADAGHTRADAKAGAA